MQSPHSETTRPESRAYELKVSPYERVAGMLLALLALIGLSVLIMFILWLTSRIFAQNEALPLQLEELGTGEGGLSGGMELDAPMADELGLETDLEQPSLENMLASVADAVATQQALLEDPMLSDEALAGKGGSTGDGRGLGKGSGAGGGRRRRWEVRFQGSTLESYARQLDSFEIELGVLIAQENKVIYARNLAKARPDTREGPADQEKRYYLVWRSGGLEEADRELLGKAGISTKGRIILKFLTPQLEDQLLTMEKRLAEQRGEDLKNVRTTIYQVVTERGQYRFRTVDQTYR